jgi:hypothetical protein
MTKKDLTAAGIHNAHDFADGRVFIDYRPAESGGMYESARWQVVWAGHKTDLKAHWRDYGCKTFDVYRRDEKEPRLFFAKKWASEEYGITKWERTPFGSWMDAGFVAQRLAQLKEKR